MTERINEAEYSSWLVEKGVPTAHLNAHAFALHLFEESGGCSVASMKKCIGAEQRDGADSSRLRNLQAAANYIASYIESQQESEKPLIDLGFDDSDPIPTESTNLGIDPSQNTQTPPAKHNGACECSPNSKPTPITTPLRIAGPSVAAIYFMTRVLAGKDFAFMANWAVLTILAVIALLSLRMRCDRCINVLDSETLSPEPKRNLLLLRGALAAAGVILILLTIRSHGKWSEKRRIVNMSDEELETEIQEEYKKDVEAELGYELSDSEFETYLEEEEAADRQEAEELVGHPLTDEEYEDSF